MRAEINSSLESCSSDFQPIRKKVAHIPVDLVMGLRVSEFEKSWVASSQIWLILSIKIHDQALIVCVNISRVLFLYRNSWKSSLYPEIWLRSLNFNTVVVDISISLPRRTIRHWGGSNVVNGYVCLFPRKLHPRPGVISSAEGVKEITEWRNFPKKYPKIGFVTGKELLII